MAAFEKIFSGIPQLDSALNHIRKGDNIVWQVDDLSVFQTFVEPFVQQAIKDGRRLVYIRFSNHAPLIREQDGVTTYHVELSHRFETFTVEIHNIIEKEGRDVFYVFDCLSELQVAWSTDLMMGNFFRVTCPFLFQLDTVAYFPILRGRHSFETIAKIQETTQIMLDAFQGDEVIYVQPLKVWKRYLPTLFMPHAYDRKTGSFTPLTDGILASRFYAKQQQLQDATEETILDSWDRFFADEKRKLQHGKLNKRELKFIIDVMMSRDSRLRTMMEHYFTGEDLLLIRSHMVGTGMIGGKACGMLLARKIIETELPEYASHLEPHDSYFIGSDVYYTYLVENQCWNLRVRQRTQEEYFSAAKPLQRAILEGHFPAGIREQFSRLLSHYGASPIIVRSSSILEDGFGNAFAGKYESVFCPNTGSPEERLEAFEQAVKIVYASMMNPAALEYRLQRGMEKRDEQMALLVQRVSGSYYPPYFMPHGAGVGFSYSTYKFMEEMDASRGMLRLVMGLGTKAVDRTQGDYPRLVSMHMPTTVLQSNSSDRHRYSQHNVDVIDLVNGTMEEVPFEKLVPLLPSYVSKELLSHDYDSERIFRDRGQYKTIYFVSCDGLTKNQQFTQMMEKVLATLQRVYQYPVDIEFTVNLGEQGDFMVNLLQCRPLQTFAGEKQIAIPEVKQTDKVLFHTKKSSMGASREESIDAIIMVDPYAYYTMPYADKPKVAKQLGLCNRYFKEKQQSVLLLTPGRIGTSSPELGVPVSFSEISGCSAICEVAYSKAGYMPELSYGSHMFQDLVEADILYCALLENEHTLAYAPELLTDAFDDQFLSLFPNGAELSSVIKVYLPKHCVLYHDFSKEETLCLLQSS